MSDSASISNQQRFSIEIHIAHRNISTQQQDSMAIAAALAKRKQLSPRSLICGMTTFSQITLSAPGVSNSFLFHSFFTAEVRYLIACVASCDRNHGELRSGSRATRNDDHGDTVRTKG
jgi:hypothetical protein